MANLKTTSTQGVVTPAGDITPARAPFGNDANAIRVITIPLDDAMEGKQFDLTGTVLYAAAASSLNATMDVALQDQHNDSFPISQGFAIRGVKFNRIFVTADAQAGESITLLVAVEKTDRLEIVNPAGVYTSVTLSRATQFLTYEDAGNLIAAGAQYQIPAYSARRSITIRNEPTNTNTLRIGDSFTSATIGYPLLPGEAFTIENNTADIYLFNCNDTGDGTDILYAAVGSFD